MLINNTIETVSDACLLNIYDQKSGKRVAPWQVIGCIVNWTRAWRGTERNENRSFDNTLVITTKDFRYETVVHLLKQTFHKGLFFLLLIWWKILPPDLRKKVLKWTPETIESFHIKRITQDINYIRLFPKLKQISLRAFAHTETSTTTPYVLTGFRSKIILVGHGTFLMLDSVVLKLLLKLFFKLLKREIKTCVFFRYYAMFSLRTGRLCIWYSLL